MFSAACWCLLLFTPHFSQSLRILAVAPFPAISHFQMIRPLIEKLAKDGHQVTVITSYPMNKENITDINLANVFPFYNLNFEQWNFFSDLKDLFAFSADECEIALASEPVQRFLARSDRNLGFDIAIVEAFFCDALLGFPLKFNIPYVTFSSPPLPIWTASWLRNPAQLSYAPEHLCRSVGTSFHDRAFRLFCAAVGHLMNYYYNERHAPRLVKKYFNLDIDNLAAVKGSVGAIFVNSVPLLTGFKATFPNIVQIGGLHIQRQRSLPSDFIEFLNKSTEGAIIFSMGSIVKASTLDPKIRNSMIEVLGKFPQRVIWKWEEDLPDLPENIKIVPWLPQSDLLGHPHVKAFISHGGVHGLLEALHHGVPIVGLPLYGDQMANLEMLKNAGMAEIVEFQPFDEKQFEEALNRVLFDSRYRESAKELSAINKDQLNTPLETAVFWIEHIAKTAKKLQNDPLPKAHHLQMPGNNLSFIEFYMIDVYVAILSTFLLISYTSWKIITFLTTYIVFVLKLSEPPKRKLK